MRFVDRRQAGVELAETVASAQPIDPVVLALPRGGVPVGFEVAQKLGCPLDVVVVRKIGLPGHPELAIGAVSEDGHVVVNDVVVRATGLDEDGFDQALELARHEMQERIAAYRSDREPIDIEAKTVVLVDDGLATGSTALAAIAAIRRQSPYAVWLAVPVAPKETVHSIRTRVEHLIVLHQPRRFSAVGAWYTDFTQTADSDVRDLLRRAAS